MNMIQNGRVLTDHLSHHLSEASLIVSVSDTSESNGFIQFEDESGLVYRYEVDADGYVVYGPIGDLVELAGPVDQFQVTCYDSNSFTVPTTDINDISLIHISTVLADAMGNEEVNGKAFVTEVHVRSIRLPGFDYSISPGVAVKQTLSFEGSDSVIDSYRSSQGDYDSGNPGSGAVVTTNDTGNHRIFLWQNTVLRGDAYVGPGGDIEKDISVLSGAQLLGFLGVLDDDISIPSISAPSYWPFYQTPWWPDDVTYSSGTASYVGNYYFDNLTITNSAVLIVSGNLTFVVKGDLVVDNDAELRIVANSSLNLYIKDKTYFRDNAKINTYAADPSRLHIYSVNNNKTVQLEDNAKVYAVLQNPSGQVSILNDSQFFGKIKAENLDGGGQIHVDLDAEF